MFARMLEILGHNNIGQYVKVAVIIIICCYTIQYVKRVGSFDGEQVFPITICYTERDMSTGKRY
jgi:hypothetical protein